MNSGFPPTLLTPCTLHTIIYSHGIKGLIECAVQLEISHDSDNYNDRHDTGPEFATSREKSRAVCDLVKIILFNKELAFDHLKRAAAQRAIRFLNTRATINQQ